MRAVGAINGSAYFAKRREVSVSDRNENYLWVGWGGVVGFGRRFSDQSSAASEIMTGLFMDALVL